MGNQAYTEEIIPRRGLLREGLLILTSVASQGPFIYNNLMVHQAVLAAGIVILVLYSYSLFKLVSNAFRITRQKNDRPSSGDYLRSLFARERRMDIVVCTLFISVGLFTVSAGLKHMVEPYELSQLFEPSEFDDDEDEEELEEDE